MKYLGIIFVIVLISSGCVPGKQFQEMESKASAFQEENDRLNKLKLEQETSILELESAINVKNERIRSLENDLSSRDEEIQVLQGENAKISELNEELMDKHAILMSSNAKEKKTLLSDLNATQESLKQRESELQQLEKVLNEKSAVLNQREARVGELEDMLAAKDMAATELKKKVALALTGFEDKGLSVEQKNGRVYVNLEAKLLFDSGSDKVEKDGKQALVKLAKAIEKQEDISILVEGHTDTDHIGGGLPYKDNWDLSVMRATSVVRILTDNSSVAPEILTAAGRSEFIPIDENDKSKNRRIEIILIPQLDELYNLIGDVE